MKHQESVAFCQQRRTVKACTNVICTPQDQHQIDAILGVKNNSKNGFTLIELLIAVAIMAIILSIGVPSFAELVKNGKISSAATCLSGALYTARSEAVKRSTNVTVCPYGDDDSCGSDWSNGTLVFSEGSTAATTPDLSAAAVDTDSTVIRICSISNPNLTISAIASSDRTVGSAAERSFIRYSRAGTANWNLGYFSMCDDRSSENWKAFNIGLKGDIRTARLASDGSALVDAFNRTLDSCE